MTASNFFWKDLNPDQRNLSILMEAQINECFFLNAGNCIV